VSQQNIDALRKAVEAYNRHDLGAFLAMTFAELRNRGRGAVGGTPVVQESWHVAEWSDQKIVWWGAHATEAEALEAARVRE
jgi:hypothetical protein